MEGVAADAADARMEAFLELIGARLGRPDRRASFATYFMGLLSDAERKSLEPLAARGILDPSHADAAHQRLQHFVTDSTWDDHAVRLEATRYALAEMTRSLPVVAWIIDDTGFEKQGNHSVGVQRQYTGTAGKVTNCQVAVSLSITTARQHLPVDFALYLPESWALDPKRRTEARIPDDVTFRTKPELALEMIRRAQVDGLFPGIVLADSGYGDGAPFRRELRTLGFHYALGVGKTAMARAIDSLGRCTGPKLTVEDLAAKLEVRRVTWREGTTSKRLTARFAFQRVVPAYTDPDIDMADREDVWLIVEHRDDSDEPRYHYCSLPADTPKKTLVYLTKERYRTEQVYREMKQELGLAHYEGRRFTGWCHHISVALCAYAFVVAEQARAFPPSIVSRIAALAANQRQT